MKCPSRTALVLLATLSPYILLSSCGSSSAGDRALIGRAEAMDSGGRTILHVDSTEIPVYGEQEQSAYKGHFAELLTRPVGSAQQHSIDTEKSTLTIYVGKTGAFSGLGHEHEVRAPIQSGTADTSSHPAVEIHVDARALRVIDKDAFEKERAEVQKTMLGPEVLDSELHQEIVFKSTGAEAVGEGRWTLRGILTLRGQTRPVTVQVMLKDAHYTGETTLKQTDYGIKPPGKLGVRAKDEVKIEFDVLLAS